MKRTGAPQEKTDQEEKEVEFVEKWGTSWVENQHMWNILSVFQCFVAEFCLLYIGLVLAVLY